MHPRMRGSMRLFTFKYRFAENILPARRPGHSTQYQNPIKRIFLRPGEMAENAAEDAAFAFLKRPDFRFVFPVQFRRGNDADFTSVADQWPIRLVQKMNLLRKNFRL